MAKMISAVIFDVGGVLVRTEDPLPRRRLEERLGLSRGAAEAMVFNSDMGRAAQLGEITTYQLWVWVQQQLQLDDSGIARFKHEFFAGDRVNVGLMAYIRTLRGSYQTAIISNAFDNLLDYLKEDYPIADAFDLIVGSAYEHIMKPQATIFERTLSRLGKAPSETVFVDDFIHNIEGARALGIHAVHYEPGVDIPAVFAELGIKSRG
jgi:epoxide hydrolase-like predicted phosphatase